MSTNRTYTIKPDPFQPLTRLHHSTEAEAKYSTRYNKTSSIRTTIKNPTVSQSVSHMYTRMTLTRPTTSFLLLILQLLNITSTSKSNAARVTSCTSITNWTEFTNAIDMAIATASSTDSRMSIVVNLCAGFDIAHDGDDGAGYTIASDNVRLMCDKKTGSAGEAVSQELNSNRSLLSNNYQLNPISGGSGPAPESEPRCVIRGTARHLNVAASGTTILGFDFYDSEYGAVQVMSSARMTNVLHSVFINNVRGFDQGDGSSLAIDSGAKLTSVLHCEFTNNEADDGGALSTAGDADVIIYYSFFHSNAAIVGSGGAVTADVGSQVVISRSEFFKNTAMGGDAPALFDAEAGEATCDAGENVACLNVDLDDESMCDGIFYEVNGAGVCDAFGLACNAPSAAPSATPTKSPTARPTSSPTSAPSVSHMPSCQPTLSPSASPTTPTSTPSAAPTSTPSSAPITGSIPIGTVTETSIKAPSKSPSYTSTKSPSYTSTSTKSPSYTSTKSPSYTSTSTKSPSYTGSTKSPSYESTKAPSYKSTKSPSYTSSTKSPSYKSTKAPSYKSTKAPSYKSKVHTHVQTEGSKHESKTHTHTSKYDVAAATEGTEKSDHSHHAYHTHGSKKYDDDTSTAAAPADVSNDSGDTNPYGVGDGRHRHNRQRVLDDSHSHTHSKHENSKHNHSHTHKSKYDEGVVVNPEDVDKCSSGPQFPPTLRHTRRAVDISAGVRNNLRGRMLSHW